MMAYYYSKTAERRAASAAVAAALRLNGLDAVVGVCFLFKER